MGFDPVKGLPLLGSATAPKASTTPPTAAQQASFGSAFAKAQVGAAGTSSDSSAKTPTQLLLFSWFQQSVNNMMAEVARVRQDASNDD